MNNTTTPSKRTSTWRQVLLAVVVVGLALFAARFVMTSAPKAEKRPSEKQARLVTDQAVSPTSEQVVVTGYGVVQAEQQVMLQAQVTGKVVKLGDSFVPGRQVKKGELLLELDDTDYQLELANAKASLAQAKAALASEEGNQAVAQADFELLDLSVSEREKSLILRKPQLETAKASVQAAEVAYERAKVNLSRTKLRAPFDGIVVSRNVSLGGLVSQTTQLGELIASTNLWINAAVAQTDLQWIEFPKGKKDGSKVCVRDASQPGDSCHEGRVLNLQGYVQDNGRQALVLVEIPMSNMNDEAPALLIGQYVKVNFAGKTLNNVYKLDPSTVHANNVWVNDNGVLKIQPINEVFRSQTMVLVDQGIQPEQKIITSNISAPVEGMKVRTNAVGTDTKPATNNQDQTPATSSNDASAS